MATTIWTEEENEERQFENMMNREGKSCANCKWGNADPGQDYVTCGHHIQNFTVDSFCAYWTDPNDPKLAVYREKRKKELLEKYANKG